MFLVAIPSCGLSPHARGDRGAVLRSAESGRSIPAHAGDLRESREQGDHHQSIPAHAGGKRPGRTIALSSSLSPCTRWNLLRTAVPVAADGLSQRTPGEFRNRTALYA